MIPELLFDVDKKVPLLGPRGTLLIRNSAPLGPYSRTVPRVLWGSYGVGLFLMSEVLLYYLP